MVYWCFIKRSYRNENIMNLELAMPERTTQDYTGPAVDARVQVC